MGESKRCVVTFRDNDGVEHTAEVVAASLYEAGALALQQFRRSDWSRLASLEVGTLRVEVTESTFYNIRVADLEKWLARSSGTPKEMTMRNNIRNKMQER
jgi:hypothetical protein